MKKLILIIFISLLGCNHMTNDEIIIEKDKCLKNNMDYDMVMDNMFYKISNVICSKPIK